MAYEGADYETITLERRGTVAILTLNRPERLNALSAALRGEVAQAVAAVKADDEVRAMVLTGAGRGFCAGADLMGDGAVATGKPAPRNTQAERLDDLLWMGRWALMFRDFDKPIIGAINGVAAGAGFSTALACDVRIGSEHARFKSVFIERAISPDSAMSYLLPRIVGYAEAADIIFTSRAVGADEALRLGLLNRLTSQDELGEAAIAYAEEMTGWPPLALRASKRVLQQNVDAEFEAALRNEVKGLDVAHRALNDAKESRAAFAEKRKGVYTGT
ncbi:enoyl-CoA hydratase/isomerase family protein [Phenylobacterium sp.]|uniref:enoyl-CoA hydratase/isomerase family protein n=1 Tax=Phenylobacterium sp. TaxID=1871053 RepID=UPI00356AA153